MLIDSHCHIFTEKIVKNVKQRPEMVEQLKLNTRDAPQRLLPKDLAESAESNGVDMCVLLPTAAPDKIRSENDRFIQFCSEFQRLRTLATLHPVMHGLSDEIGRMFDLGINGFKFSSFSQRFDLATPEVETMLKTVERLGHVRGRVPALVFDTFATADMHFGAHPDHLTTPAKLSRLAARHPGINFISAHMGGLLAGFEELRRDLEPSPNLYLDTANAAHTLAEAQFVELLRIHGASHVLFGTDWPWFDYASERPKVNSLLVQAGYNNTEQAKVFGGNAERLLSL
jgi:predicted TIM-barrel fold metal-dependent hydrolase